MNAYNLYNIALGTSILSDMLSIKKYYHHLSKSDASAGVAKKDIAMLTTTIAISCINLYLFNKSFPSFAAHCSKILFSSLLLRGLVLTDRKRSSIRSYMSSISSGAMNLDLATQFFKGSTNLILSPNLLFFSLLNNSMNIFEQLNRRA